MPFEIVHDVEAGTRQLLEAPADLAEFVVPQGTSKRLSAATEEHKKLYMEYLGDFRRAYALAEDWWTGCVDAFVELGYSRDDAIDMAYDKRLAGPASAPEVVWFVREYWLECARLNITLPEHKRVPPQVLLLEWLVADGHEEYVRLLTCMPYWPLGLDSTGNWC